MRNVSDLILDRLEAWDVKRLFGYPGDGINGLFGAINRAGDRFEYIQPRHEEMSAFMACGHAKFTGELGVCISTSGPGAVHMLNGLYDAKLDHQPVLAIVGQQARSALGSSYLQEIDLPALLKDVAHEYVHMATTAEQVPHLLDRAIRTALSQRTVTCLVLPTDVQELKAVEDPPHKHYFAHSGPGYAAPRVMPEAAELQRAADVLNAGERVAILVGQGALGASVEVAQVADILGAGVAKALLGKAVLDDDLPFVTGSIGLLGTKPSWDLMDQCDTLLMIGSGFPYGEFLPEVGQARGVQIDIDGRALGLRYPMEVNLTGDSAQTLRALIDLLEAKSDRSWREKIENGVGKWHETMEARAMAPGDPVNPQRVFWELSSRLPHDALLAVDVGSSTDWYARDVKLKTSMRAAVSGTLASMGCAMPYALAAKFAHPDRPVIALVGDGAMQMNGNAELITVAKYFERWRDPRLIVMVLNNRDLNQVTWEQRGMLGDPKFEGSQDLPDFPYAAYAQMLGLQGRRVDSPDQLGAAWDDAFAADRPFVLEVITDPSVPPLPPHITLEQARAFASAIRHGDPDARAVIGESVRQKLAGLISTSLHP